MLAVDISAEALHVLSESARDSGLEGRITVLCAALDDLNQHVQKQDFDVVLSCYSLYYAKDPAGVFTAVHRALKPGGIFFFCGPAKDNNLELKQFHWGLRGGGAPAETGAAVFMQETGQRLAGELFSTVEVSTFQNPLRFDSPEALYSYWSSYNLYDQKLDAAFRSAAASHFQSHSVFETIKRVIGVKAAK